MDDDRYGRDNPRRTALLGLIPAAAMFVIGGYYTLVSWGVLAGDAPPKAVEMLAPALAGLGVALAWVCVRPAKPPG